MNEQPLHALPQGHRLQEYELMRVLGFGGFGMTYLGFDHNLDKAVAIKEYLPSDIATRTADHSVAPQASDFHGDFQWGLERFLDEARTLARFDHHHIIKVYRFFEAHGTAYIVMEYAEGETLSAYLERKRTLEEAELKALLYSLLDGLEVVHKADFLHRDIKPGNIIIRDSDGSPVLLDFGAARQAIGAKSRSVTSIVTPGYAPIEQYSSRGRQGAWTDIYALGGVCYRALTGDVPEDATDRVRHDPLVPVSQRCARQASQAFLAAIDKALSVDEGDRPPSVAAWREALGASASSPAARAGQAEQRAAAEEVQKTEADDATIVRQRYAPLSQRQKQSQFKWLAIALGVVAVLVGVKMSVDHAEQIALERQRREQATLERQRREQAALERQRQEQAALEKQRQEEQATLERQRREQAALERQRQEQVALERQRQEQAALEKQRQGQVALEKQRREQAALERQRQEQAVLKKERVYSLHDAAKKNAYEAAEVLLRQGAKVNAKDNRGLTPLHRAAWKDASATAEVLLRQGAKVNAKDNRGLTPLHYAVQVDASSTAEVLLNQGAKVNAKDNSGWTSLHHAAQWNASELAEMLLNRGADVHAKKDGDGWTPLHHAARKNASSTVEVLLNREADVHAKDNNGWTPLHHAARKNASSAAEVLLKAGADIHAKDNNGWTPLHHASMDLNNAETAEVLRRYGARK